MNELRPFRALRYDASRVELGRVLAPPYDVIAADDRARLYELDPHNAVRLELTRDAGEERHTDYSAMRQTLDAWRADRVLVRDPQPALYALRQNFLAPDEQRYTREGFFGLLRLADYAEGSVRPHERTLSGPKDDRMKLLRATDANLSAVFLLYAEQNDALRDALAPAFEAGRLASAEDESGARHTLAPIEEPERIEALRALVAPHPLVIADGHHRYETALAYRDTQRAGSPATDAPYEWILVYVGNALAPGNLLLPIHRLIRKGAVPTETAWRERLPGWSYKAVRIDGADAVPEALARHLEPLHAHHAFAADDASGTLRVFSRPKGAPDELTVRVVHREVIDGVFDLDERSVREGAIEYPKSALQTARELRTGGGAVALYLNPIAPADVFRVAAAGEVLPQKSTFFYPKLPTGLVFRTLGES